MRALPYGCLAAPRCFYQHRWLILERQQQKLICAPTTTTTSFLSRCALRRAYLQFRMDSSPSLHLYHWLWRCCSLVGVPGGGSRNWSSVRCSACFLPHSSSFYFWLYWQRTHNLRAALPKWECICICCCCSTISFRVLCVTRSLLWRNPPAAGRTGTAGGSFGRRPRGPGEMGTTSSGSECRETRRATSLAAPTEVEFVLRNECVKAAPNFK